MGVAHVHVWDERLYRRRARSSRVVKLRPATLNDASMLLAWRNDLNTRLASKNVGLVDEATHARWLDERLRDPKDHLYIAMEDDAPVGVGRIQDAEVSLTISPTLRGRGYARELIFYLCEQARELGMKELTATVFTTNRFSLLAFIHEEFELAAIDSDATRSWVTLRRDLA